jgi:hypothetical protein
MYTQTNLPCDVTTAANLKTWASYFNTFLTAAGWQQTTDTGQVNWSTFSTLPGSNSQSIYEIWTPNDGLTPFYVKFSYGLAGTNIPQVWITLSTGTDGAGNPNGTVMGIAGVNQNGASGPGTGSTGYECNFSGGAGRFAVMMWRATGLNWPFVIAIERSINSSGSYTSAYVTLFVVHNQEPSAGVAGVQQSMSLAGLGIAPASTSRGTGSGSGLIARTFSPMQNVSGTPISSAWNGTIPFDTCSPCIGYYDYPCTAIGIAWGADFVEGVPFTTTVYGTTHNYLPSKQSSINAPQANIGANGVVAIRID